MENRIGLDYEQGFYIFGGVDARGVCRNELWLVAPDYDFNKSSLGILNCDFTSAQHFGLTVKEITNAHGQPPCPRFGF